MLPAPARELGCSIGVGLAWLASPAAVTGSGYLAYRRGIQAIAVDAFQYFTGCLGAVLAPSLELAATQGCGRAGSAESLHAYYEGLLGNANFYDHGPYQPGDVVVVNTTDASTRGLPERFAFGSKKPHSIWAGVQPSSQLAALQADIERACQRIGLPPEPRKFTPHVTLARLKNARVDDVVHYLTGRGDFSAMPFTVGRFLLMSSRDSTGGGPYVVEEEYPLTHPLPSRAAPLGELRP